MAIKKYTDAEQEAIGNEPYYLAVSAMHKSIRRGDTTRSVNFAKVCWRLQPRRLYGRLWLVLYEDCGRDLPALLVFYKHQSGCEVFEDLIPLIVSLCKAQKSRDPACLSEIIRGTHVIPSVLKGWMSSEPVHDRVLDLYEAWPVQGFDVYDVWEFGVGRANYDWTIELAELAMQWDSSGCSVGSPYFFMTKTFEERQGTDEVHNMGHLYDGWFPLIAVDVITKPGKIAYREYIKGGNTKYQETVRGLGDLVFQLEGSKHKNHIKYKFDFCQLSRRMREGPRGTDQLQEINDPLKEHYDTVVLPGLVKTRTWVLNTLFADDMATLKRIYADQWLPIEDEDNE